MTLDQDDIRAIEAITRGVVSERFDQLHKELAEPIRLVYDHELTVYGPQRQNGLRGKQKEADGRLTSLERRWYKLVAYSAAAQALVAAIAWAGHTFRWFGQ